MASDVKLAFLNALTDQFGAVKRLPGSRSLFELGDDRTRVYVRYSKVHRGEVTFFGLREHDLKALEGHPSVICFLWDTQTEPLIIPFDEYEEVFRIVEPASDGQYKAHVYLQDSTVELYIAKAGRFNVEGRFGWSTLTNLVERSRLVSLPDLSHSQVQTMLASIGTSKGYDIWVPASDRGRLDPALAPQLELRGVLPSGFAAVSSILQEIDVIWLAKGSNHTSSFFEVEHSTPIYSALLRFNDVHLTAGNAALRFSVVANDARHSLFVRQLARPTFRTSGLSERCSFLEYADVFLWHRRLQSAAALLT